MTLGWEKGAVVGEKTHSSGLAKLGFASGSVARSFRCARSLLHSTPDDFVTVSKEQCRDSPRDVSNLADATAIRCVGWRYISVECNATAPLVVKVWRLLRTGLDAGFDAVDTFCCIDLGY